MPRSVQYGEAARAVCDELRTRIISGEYSSGSELRIQSLAREFNVSIVPVREAIRTLAAEGLVKIRPRRSPTVAKPKLTEVKDISEIRILLEPILLQAAVPNHNRETLDRCHEVLKAEEGFERGWQKVALNREFHHALLFPSGKERLLKILEAQYESMSLLARTMVNAAMVRYDDSHGEHVRILEAVERRDTGLALDCLKDHLNRSHEKIDSVLDRREFASTPVPENASVTA